MRNTVLIGMRGCGKSSLGKVLAKKQGRPFIDTDILIEKASGKSISQIVSESGWEAFRDLETTVCKKVGEKEGAVIAVGGGAILREENVVALKKNGVLVFLNVPLSILEYRIRNGKKGHRPSLTGKNIAEELREIWEARKQYYHESANITFSVCEGGGSVSRQVRELLTLLQSFESICKESF
ncbi:shikimate kinase [Candidatus Peregrinibacteria bacterium]|nr:MAG: shikimate kinase [Candidatus Peregrinibacteria bacterium]